MGDASEQRTQTAPDRVRKTTPARTWEFPKQFVALWREDLFDPDSHNDSELALRLKRSVDRELLQVASVIGTVMGGWVGHRGWIYWVGVRAPSREEPELIP